MCLTTWPGVLRVVSGLAASPETCQKCKFLAPFQTCQNRKLWGVGPSHPAGDSDAPVFATLPLLSDTVPQYHPKPRERRGKKKREKKEEKGRDEL